MNYTFDMFKQDISALYQLIQTSGQKYDEIVALVRGGAIPGVWLSHKLGIPIRFVQLSFLEGSLLVEMPALLQIEKEIRAGRKFLVVDDILDSGRTLCHFYDMTGQLTDLQPHLAVLIQNITCPRPVQPQFAGRTIDRRFDKEWVNFWWEEK